MIAYYKCKRYTNKIKWNLNKKKLFYVTAAINDINEQESRTNFWSDWESSFNHKKIIKVSFHEKNIREKFPGVFYGKKL